MEGTEYFVNYQTMCLYDNEMVEILFILNYEKSEDVSPI